MFSRSKKLCHTRCHCYRDAISSERSRKKYVEEEEVERSDEFSIDWKLIIALGGEIKTREEIF